MNQVLMHQNYTVGQINLQVETYFPIVLFKTEMLMQPKVADVGMNIKTYSTYSTFFFFFTWVILK